MNPISQKCIPYAVAAAHKTHKVLLFGGEVTAWTKDIFKNLLQYDSQTHAFMRLCQVWWWRESKLGNIESIPQQILQNPNSSLHTLAKFCPNQSSVRGDIHENVQKDPYNIGIKSIGFS